MKGLIIYRGKYGTTFQYVDWLGKKLQLPITSPDEIGPGDLQSFDFIVLAGSIYIGKWMLRDWVKIHRDVFTDKKLFFLMVCGTPASNRPEQLRLAKTNIPDSLVQKSDVFFLPGRVVISKLSWIDRLFLKMGARMEKDPVKKRQMLEGYDAVSQEHLEEVIKKIQSFVHEPGTSDIRWYKMVGQNN